MPLYVFPRAPTTQVLTSTGTSAGRLFTLTTVSTMAAGDTYTNNGVTYTALYALSAINGQVLFMSGFGPVSGTTLTRATGSGTSSITFTVSQILAVYTTPASCAFLKVRMMGAGGGGGGTGTASQTAGGTGFITTFGQYIIAGGNGGGTGTNSALGTGGTAGTNGTLAVPGLVISGGVGASTVIQSGSPTTNNCGGAGGNGPFGGAGLGRAGTTGVAGATNSGAGGSGGGGNATVFGAAGGAAGNYAEAYISGPAASYYYSVGTAGSAGGIGTSGTAGAAGGSGIIIVEEQYIN